MISLREKTRNQLLAKRRNMPDASTFDEKTRGMLDKHSEITQEGLMDLTAALSSASVNTQHEALVALRNLSAQEGFGMQRLLDCDVVMQLVAILAEKKSNANANAVPLSELQCEAVWILNNIAASGSKFTKALVPACAHLIMHAMGSTADLRKQAIWAMGNVAADPDAQLAEILMRQGLLDPIMLVLAESEQALHKGQALSQQHLSLLVVSAWTLSHLLRRMTTTEMEAFLQAEHGACVTHLFLLVCGRLRTHNNNNNKDNPRQQSVEHPEELMQVFVELAWCQAYATARAARCFFQQERCSEVLQGVLAGLEGTQEQGLVIPLLRVLGNMIAENAEISGMLSENRAHIEGSIVQHFMSSHHGIAKEAAWVLSNVTADCAAAVHTLLEMEFVPTLCERFIAAQFELKRELACLLYNMCNCSAHGHVPDFPTLLDAVVDYKSSTQDDVVSGFVHFLRCCDNKAVCIALQFVELLLRRYSGIRVDCRTDTAKGPTLFEATDGLLPLEELRDSDDVYIAR
jgi:hypothetical protein